MLTLMSSILVTLYLMKGEAAQVISPMGRVCPGEAVNFTCSTLSSPMRWTADHGIIGRISQISFATDSSSSIEYRFLGNEHLFMATLVSRTPELVSNLTVVAVMELDGLNIQCTDSTGRKESVLHLAGLPPFLANLQVTSITKETHYAVLNLQWNPSILTNVIQDQATMYTVTVSTELSRATLWTTTVHQPNSVALALPYNVNHTISVTATNCAGNGPATRLNDIRIVNCSTPPAVDGMVTEPYNDTTEEAVVYYHCDNQFGVPTNDERGMIMCKNNGNWSPQTQNTVNCVLPYTPEDTVTTKRLDEQNDIEKIFQCETGSGNFVAVCMQDTPLNCTPLSTMISCNTSSTSHADVGCKLLIGLMTTCTGAAIGISAILFLVTVCYIAMKKSWRPKKEEITVENNIAYETVTVEFKRNSNH